MSKKVSSSLCFYQDQRLVPWKQADRHSLILRGNKLPIAQFGGAGGAQNSMLGADGKESIFSTKSAEAHEMLSFTVYGYSSTLPSSFTLLGFNGEFFAAAHSSYPLGNGHRSFSPVIMRFLSPDSLSPFLAGGLNPYAYCGSDPINAVDPSGRIKLVVTKTTVRGPVDVVTKLEPNTRVSSRTPVVTDENGSYILKRYWPDPIVKKTVFHVVDTPWSKKTKTGHVLDSDYQAFTDIHKQIKQRESSGELISQREMTDLDKLWERQRSFLVEGNRQLNAAKDALKAPMAEGITVTIAMVRDGG